MFYNQNSCGECTLHCYDFIGCLEIANGRMNGLGCVWNTTITLYIALCTPLQLFTSFSVGLEKMNTKTNSKAQKTGAGLRSESKENKVCTPAHAPKLKNALQCTPSLDVTF